MITEQAKAKILNDLAKINARIDAVHEAVPSNQKEAERIALVMSDCFSRLDKYCRALEIPAAHGRLYRSVI